MRPSSRSWQLRIDGKTVDRIEGFADRLRERGMCVDGLEHRAYGGFRVHGRHCFGNQLERLGANDVDPEDLAVVLVGDHFDETFMPPQNGGPAVAGKGEPSDLDRIAFGA